MKEGFSGAALEGCRVKQGKEVSVAQRGPGRDLRCGGLEA